jgi:hypothetical protein
LQTSIFFPNQVIPDQSSQKSYIIQLSNIQFNLTKMVCPSDHVHKNMYNWNDGHVHKNTCISSKPIRFMK